MKNVLAVVVGLSAIVLLKQMTIEADMIETAEAAETVEEVETAALSEVEADMSKEETEVSMAGVTVPLEEMTKSISGALVPRRGFQVPVAEGWREGECKCEFPWQHVYAEVINGLEYYAGFYIGDITGDEIPEAVIDLNTLGGVVVLYHTESGIAILDLETVSAWGSVTYIADTNQFLFSPFYGHTTGTWGYEEYYIYDWNGKDYVQTYSIFRESGYYQDEETNEYGECYINGEKTDNDTFEAELEKIEKLKEENEGYFQFWYLNEEGFENRVKELLPCLEIPEYEGWF